MPENVLPVVLPEDLHAAELVRQSRDPGAPARVSGAGQGVVAAHSSGARQEGNRVTVAGRTLRLWIFDHDSFDDDGTFFGDEPIQ